jgi:hypothetical protein
MLSWIRTLKYSRWPEHYRHAKRSQYWDEFTPGQRLPGLVGLAQVMMAQAIQDASGNAQHLYGDDAKAEAAQLAIDWVRGKGQPQISFADCCGMLWLNEDDVRKLFLDCFNSTWWKNHAFRRNIKIAIK